MSNVISFPNEASMRHYLHRAGEQAKRGLHPQQYNLTHGDHWMQVIDLETRHVVFGRILTLAEVADDEMKCGVSEAAVRLVLDKTTDALEDGLMYGRAHDRFDPRGELGHTHKANAWPIDEHVFDEVAAHGYFVDEDLPLHTQVNLNIAWMGFRAWRRQRESRMRGAV